MDIEIIVGSTLGTAEYVADELQAKLCDQHQVQIHLNADIKQLNTNAIWFICSSTHGAGDVPDNLQPFYQSLLEQKPDLSSLRYLVIAIGSKSYDSFCQAGKDLDHLLAQLGATPLVERLEIDVDTDPVPEEPAIEWLLRIKNKLKAR